MIRRNSGGNIIVGVILIALGVLFLVAQFVEIDIWSLGWPFIIIGVGLLFFLGMFLGGRAAGGLAIPGSVVTMVGLILLFQNTFNRWESWSYAWTLIVMAVGSGLYIKGLWEHDAQALQAGVRTAGIGIILFLIFGAFFEIGFGYGGFERAGGVLWSLLLMGAGVYLLLRRGTTNRDIPHESMADKQPLSKSASNQS